MPFKLTNAQVEVTKQIFKDMQSRAPMNRLLQGDVGSGKTIVAVVAMLAAMENNLQAALMAPTEILAEQHARSIKRLLARTPYRIELLTGSVRAAEKRHLQNALKEGEINACIGTQALIQGSRDRLRPVLMTMGCTILGMTPLCLGTTQIGGDGPPYYPMARAIVGGLIFSTAVTLLALPTTVCSDEMLP